MYLTLLRRILPKSYSESSLRRNRNFVDKSTFTVAADQKDDFAYVFDVLQHDGCLVVDDNRCVQFFSNLLLDYWRRKGQV